MKLLDRIKIIPRSLLKDDRGWFLKSITGSEENLPTFTSETYFTSALPGKAKAGHYHKLATEWFTLITGSCTLRLQDPTTRESATLELSADKPCTVVVPPGIAHLFVNNSTTPFILSAYASVLYDPADTILFEFS